MDPVRIGLSIRALRRRRGWTQARLAATARVSRSVVQRMERGDVHTSRLDRVMSVANALGATVSLRLLWHGEALDRLLDAGHATLVEEMLRLLVASGWVTATEVSFNVAGERGSIDILAYHPATGSLLVVEVKSVVPDLQAMLHGLDRKARVARSLARERGWQVRTASRLLVLPGDRTTRRRIESHRTTFDVALPARTAAVRRWLRLPHGPLAGILVLRGGTAGTPDLARHRIRR